MIDQPTSPQQNSLLQMAWKHARDAMFVADIHSGIVIEANPAAEILTSYSRQELLGMHQSLLSPEAERNPACNAFKEATTQGGTFEGFHILRKDGEYVPVTISSSAPFEVEGRWLVIGIFRDITDLEDREHRLTIKRWALHAYAAAALALMRADSSATLMQDICEAITKESIFVLAWVGFAEEGPEKPVRWVGAAGSALAYMEGLEVSWSADKPSGQGPGGIALRTGTVQIIENSETDAFYKPWRERARRVGIRSSATIPFQAEEGRNCALTVYSSQTRAFGPIVIEAFIHLAEEIGIGLRSLRQAERLEAERQQREQAQQELAEAMRGVVSAITTAMEMRDPYTAGHQHRVAELACAIAKEMGWAENRSLALRVAAQVHDIGKIAIPAEILTKTTQLTKAEWALIREHPETGYLIMKDVPFHWPIAETVRQHHERMDGSGYPRGLKGNAILLGARILAVADIVESMASARPYRAARGMDVALKEIESQAGTLLDAEVVRICVRLFREQGFVLPS
jgi:PAS domain S-box-containing protein